jgi:hypothetical protein
MHRRSLFLNRPPGDAAQQHGGGSAFVPGAAVAGAPRRTIDGKSEEGWRHPTPSISGNRIVKSAALRPAAWRPSKKRPIDL